jgi:hypothetical protein
MLHPAGPHIILDACRPMPLPAHPRPCEPAPDPAQKSTGRAAPPTPPHPPRRSFRLLLSYPQVIITPHSAFLTKEALKNIADTTIGNLHDYAHGRPLANEVRLSPHS